MSIKGPTAMSDSSYPVAFLEVTGDGTTDFLDYPGIVTANEGAVETRGLESCPVCGIEGDGHNLDEDVVVEKLWYRDLL